MGKKAIATFGVGKHADLLKMSLPTFERYAALHGYDLHVCPCDSDGRAPAWGKIRALQSLLPSYDDVLWLDADVLIVAPEEDVATCVPANCLQGMVAHSRRGGLTPNTGVWLTRPGMIPYLVQAWEMTQYIHHPWWEQAAIIELMGFSLQGLVSHPPQVPNDFYAQTAWLPLHWNAGPDDLGSLDGPPRIFHAFGSHDLKVKRMWQWAA